MASLRPGSKSPQNGDYANWPLFDSKTGKQKAVFLSNGEVEREHICFTGRLGESAQYRQNGRICIRMPWPKRQWRVK